MHFGEHFTLGEFIKLAKETARDIRSEIQNTRERYKMYTKEEKLDSKRRAVCSVVRFILAIAIQLSIFHIAWRLALRR